MIKYYDLGADKQLNEIVMAGSHDAGITGGGSNVQTQNAEIGEQAHAGVRVFDLRVTAATGTATHGGVKEAQLRAFHADPKLMKNETKSRFVTDTGRKETITRTKLQGGAFGLGLTAMLQQARSFVEKNDTEFLILKFDKCQNWSLIAETCVEILGPRILTGQWNLNTTKLRDLAGHAICVFTKDGLEATPKLYRDGNGIMGVKNLSSGGSYAAEYNGLQYFGKGGTSVFNPFDKIGQNAKKQGKLMSRGAAGDPNVLGMMYWTTTGMIESIRKRNDTMWSVTNTDKLRRLWEAGLGEAIESRIARHIDPTNYSSGPVLKAFMPNMIMVDFADDTKCHEIYDLNNVATTKLTTAAREVDRDIKQVQQQYSSLQQRRRF